MFDWSEQTVLITGGTGSFGRCCTRLLLDDYAVGKVIVYSRDELKQHEMRTGGFDDDRVRWFIGDVRDRARLWRAFNGVTVVIHAAAMKQVPACEYNPVEAVRTNVDGTVNVVDACLDRDVARLMFISSDKACDPATLYGSTKAVGERLVVAANAYAGTRCAAVRYGNVIGSRGSIVPLFREQAKTGRVTVTDPDATRFWLTREMGVRFTLDALVEGVVGGEVFVPNLCSSTVAAVVEAVAPGCEMDVIGLRAGEKRHEALVSPHELQRTYYRDGNYGGFMIVPPELAVRAGVSRLTTYTSDGADRLSPDELAGLISDEGRMAARSG